MYTNNPKEMTKERLDNYINNLKGFCFSYGMQPDTPEDYLKMLYDDLKIAEKEKEKRHD